MLNINLFKQFLKFGAVGVLNTLVDLGVLTILIYFEPTGKAGLLYALFKAIAFIVANINSYVFNKFWTFREDGGQKRTTVEFSEYFLVSLIGMLINVSVASLVVNYFLIYEYHPVLAVLQKPWPQISALFGTAFGLVWNFLGYKFLVFTRKNKPAPAPKY